MEAKISSLQKILETQLSQADTDKEEYKAELDHLRGIVDNHANTIQELELQNDQLKAENERLSKLLQQQQAGTANYLALLPPQTAKATDSPDTPATAFNPAPACTSTPLSPPDTTATHNPLNMSTDGKENIPFQSKIDEFLNMDMTERKKLVDMEDWDSEDEDTGEEEGDGDDEKAHDRKKKCRYLKLYFPRPPAAAPAQVEGGTAVMPEYEVSRTKDPYPEPGDADYPELPKNPNYLGYPLTAAEPTELAGTVNDFGEGPHLSALLRIFEGIEYQWAIATLLVCGRAKKMRRKGYQDIYDVQWVSDKDAASCCGCGDSFTMTLRRHHCRMCGYVFCGTCAGKKRSVSQARPEKVRVCSVCVRTLHVLNTFFPIK